MINNGIIRITLGALLSSLDARKNISVFLDFPLLEKQNLLADTQVYKLEADESFIEAYGDYPVIGIANNITSLSIMIKEG
jgi:hypothetical protein